MPEDKYRNANYAPEFHESEEKTEIDDSEMLRVIQEEGFSAYRKNNGEISINVEGLEFTFGKSSRGFIFGRHRIELDIEEKWLAMRAAQDVGLCSIATKVLVMPRRRTVLFSIESLCNNPETFRRFVRLSIPFLSRSVLRYHFRMKELRKGRHN